MVPVKGMAGQIIHPGRAMDPQAAKLDRLVIQKPGVAKRLRALGQRGFNIDVMVAASAQYALEPLPPEPVVHLGHLPGVLVPQLEHVAAMDQQIPRWQAEARHAGNAYR